ncbi:MAG: hypothetical protein HGA23_11855, partial [Bacteroidales bacterium]|nr:hypothetical protein [Bacteroidales bacterium]
ENKSVGLTWIWQIHHNGSWHREFSNFRAGVENAGLEGSVIVQRVREGKGDFGFNARTEKYENLFESGVIDPTKVARVALENAASIAGMLLTTECLLSDSKEDKEPKMPMGGGGMHDGMY